ncbi:MAG: hypothetical protein OEQ12_06555 [Nitrosopumilus sp.]|nr:hypothetical protein [Nitrosopumilus sp.]
MTITKKIGHYQLLIFGKRYSTKHAVAKIYLYDNRRYYIGTVDFYRDGQVIPRNSLNDAKRIFLNMHERQIDTVVDMLRNERPCWVKYHSPTSAYLTTEKEQVGEDDIQEPVTKKPHKMGPLKEKNPPTQVTKESLKKTATKKKSLTKKKTSKRKVTKKTPKKKTR